jgi:hypothetical protein
MSLCGICIEPGHCCKRFKLYKGDQEANVQHVLESGFAFVVCGIDHHYFFNDMVNESYYYKCLNLDEEGHCIDYENRPLLCENFEPGSNRICCYHSVSPLIPKREDSSSAQEKELCDELA